MKRFTKCMGMLLAIVLCCTGLFTQNFAKETAKPKRTIYIGYIDYDNFIEKADGEGYSGYGVDYLKKISQYTNWQYVYVYGSWEKIMEQLKEGEIDFVCQAQKTKEREEDYLFSKYPIGSETSILYVRKNDERYYYNDYNAFDGMRVGMMKGSYQNEEFAYFAESNNFTYTQVEYDNSQECFDELNKGTVDAVAMGSLAAKTNYRIVGRFGSDAFYMMTGKKNVELMDELNDTLGKIKGSEANYETDLYNRYYGETNAKAGISLTREEAMFVKDVGKIEVAFLPNRAPHSYKNHNGNVDGITREIMDLISLKSRLKFHYVFMEQGQDVTHYLQKNPNALVTGIMLESNEFKDDRYILSTGYYTDDIVLAAKGGTEYNFNAVNGTYTLAVPKSFRGLQMLIEEKYPQFNIMLCDDTEECVKHVIKKEAQFLAQNVNVIKPFTQNPHYEELSILPSYFATETNGIAGNNTAENQILMSIINKCIASMSEQEKEQIVINQTLVYGYKPTAKDYIYKFRLPIYIIVFLLMVLFVCIAWVFNMRRKSYDRVKEANTELTMAMTVAERANESKSQFLAQISHEIRTPMNAIVGLISIAKKEKNISHEMNHYLSEIEESSKVLLRLINDVLDMSSIEGNKMKIDSAAFNIKKEFAAICKMFYQQAKEKDIVLLLQMDEVTQEIVIGDKLRVNQIVMNLLSNAIKFTPEDGNVTVHVMQSNITEDSVNMQICVIDDGVGMHQEMMDRIFRPFEQESAKVAQKYGGSGLGLAIVKSLIELMEGTIRVDSKPGKGTTFTVELPFKLLKEEELQKTEELEQLRTLAIIEKEDLIKELKALFEQLGMPYDFAYSGDEGLEKIGDAEEQRNPYELCIVDTKLPDMTGEEVMKQIHDIFGERALVLLALLEEDRYWNAELTEANHAVMKPISKFTLYNELMNIVGKEATVTSKHGSSEYDFSGKKILIAEDIELNTKVIVKLLDMVNAEAVCAKNGIKAVDLFRNSAVGTYDCVLLDINMPLMNGYEAAREIRESRKADAKTVPIYAMTANAFASDIKKALDAGMNGHIAKPIDTQVLYQTLQNAFTKEK